ncbi:MAG TPA: methyltransferase domain-containing protein [Longimicrobiales bacterium]
MAEAPDRLRRDSFDSVAEVYERARPRYPEQLVDDLTSLAGIGEGTRVLEIGPGTGQLSVPLAERGAFLVAVERGPNLANVLRRRLSRFDHAAVVVADFDRWDAPPASFDVVVAATAFHWLDPSTRVLKAAKILRPGGSLAIVQTRWGVATCDDPFFAASQACYSRWYPNHDPTYRQIRPEDVPDPCVELSIAEFAHVVHRRYLCDREYSATAYCELLSTFSDVISLEDERRAGFLACMSRLIDSRFGGRIVRHDLHDLCVARAPRRV